MNTKETIVVVGYGWVGQANALALSRLGCRVSYYDIAEPQIHYPEFSDLYRTIPRIHDLFEQDALNTWYMVCVGDTVRDGYQDVSRIKDALDNLRNAKGKVMLRSTILPQYLKDLRFHCYMPEFLHEKNAVEEALHPYYLVLSYREGAEEPEFVKELKNRSGKIFVGTPEEASYIKYLSNSWNAIRIAFINEFGDLVSKSGFNPNNVLNFIFEGRGYLRYGKSFGGHCLPKDLSALAGSHKSDFFKAVLEVNEAHKEREKDLPEWFSSWNQRSTVSYRALVRMLIKKLVKKS